MSLYDKLLPWRSQRSGTSLAGVCAGNALQMGEQLPHSRVRLLLLLLGHRKCSLFQELSEVTVTLKHTVLGFFNCKCYLCLYYPTSLMQERAGSKDKHLCPPLNTSDAQGSSA